MVIHRFDIETLIDGEGNFNLSIPEDAVILHVDEQTRAPHHMCMWVMLDPSEMHVTRNFRMVGTGWTFDLREGFIATVQMRTGFVWHIFDVFEDSDENG